MKKLFFIVAILLIATHYINAQIIFQKIYRATGLESVSGVIETADKGYLLYGGVAINSTSGTDMYLIKTNVAGDTLWTKIYMGPSNEFVRSVIQTNDKGFVFTASADSSIYILKIDSTGNLLWSKDYSMLKPEGGNSLIQTNDGGFAFTGSMQTGTLIKDIFLFKTDSLGVIEWNKSFYTGAVNHAVSLNQTEDGGYLLGGTCTAPSGTYRDMCLIRTNAIGDTLWTKRYNCGVTSILKYVLPTEDKGFLILGSSNWLTTGLRAGLIKVDSSGQVLWARKYSCSQITLPGNQSISISKSGENNYMIYSVFDDRPCLVKIDSAKNVLWAKSYTASWFLTSEFSCGIPANDGGFVLVKKKNNPGGYDGFFLVKTDSLGDGRCNQINQPILSDTLNVSSFGGSISVSSFSPQNPNQVLDADYFPCTTYTFCTSVGMETYNNLSSLQISVSPNPTDGNFTIQLPDDFKNEKDLLLKIYDNIGRLVSTISLDSGSDIYTLSLKNQSTGLYYLALNCAKGNFTSKIIKSN